MKRVFVYLLTGLFLFVFSGNVTAVTKNDTKPPVKSVVKKKTKPKKKSKPEPKQSPKSSKKIVPAKKKYDDFIDKNRNGIDDRKEKLRPKTAPKKVPEKGSKKKKKDEKKK